MLESPTTDKAEPEFYTVAEAAEILKVDPRTVRKAIDEGRLPGIKVGGKALRIPGDTLRRWAKGETE